MCDRRETMKDENKTIEYKKSLAQLKEGVISLSSMLNKSHKGELFFGITPEKKPFKFDISKKTLADLSNEIRTNLKPLPIELDVEVVKFEGIDVIRVYVEGDDTPYSAYGRYYYRVDDGDIPMSNDQLQKYFEKKENNYSKWEDKPTNYSYDDIDEDLLINVIRTANDKGRLNYVYRGIGEALTKLDLIDENGKIKTAGYYLFGKGKPITLKEANFPTDSRTEFGEIKEFKGNVFECIAEAISYILNHISFKSDITGIQRIDTPEIPKAAIREIVVNSFAHSKYDVKGDYNQIVVYKSSVRIYNPGSIYKNLDPMKFASSQVGSKIRNILIASALYKCGYIDAFGTGFDRTFTLCIKNNIKYEYKNDDFGFTFIFYRDPNYLNDEINDKINDKINELDEAILSEIRNNKYVTIPELGNKIAKSNATIYRHVGQLIKKGMLRRIGSRKTGYWEIL